MKIEKRKLAELSLDPKNARKHNKKNLEAIKGSLTKFGQQKPIVVTKENVIIAGNGTYAAAKELGWTEIDVVVSTLDAVNQKAFALADNRTAELAEWDDSFLTETLKSLGEIKFDLGSIGFDESFVKGHVRSEPGANDDVVPDVPKNAHNVKRGQIWKLGEHRLMCGDSTIEDDVAKLMDGKKADMVFTDPPYGIDVQTDWSATNNMIHGKLAMSKNHSKIIGDQKTFNAEFVLKMAKEVFLFGANYYAHSLPQNEGSWIVWDKRLDEKYDAVLGSCFELAWSKQKHKQEIARIQWVGVYGVKDDLKGSRQHPTQKPVQLAEWFFNKWGNETKTVIDLFLGSGSTLIACEKTNRTCFGMELDEHYCSVIIERWQQFTGKKAELLKLN